MRTLQDAIEKFHSDKSFNALVMDLRAKMIQTRMGIQDMEWAVILLRFWNDKDKDFSNHMRVEGVLLRHVELKHLYRLLRDNRMKRYWPYFRQEIKRRENAIGKEDS